MWETKLILPDSDFEEELHFLLRLVQPAIFRIVIVEYNLNRKVIEIIRDRIQSTYPSKKTITINEGEGQDSLIQSIYQAGEAVVFFEDAGELLKNNSLSHFLNQRRDKLSQYPVSLLFFLPKGRVNEFALKMPDIFSRRSAILEFSLLPEKNYEPEQLPLNDKLTKSQAEVQPELERLLHDLEITPESNQGLTISLLKQVFALSIASGNSATALKYGHQLLDMTRKEENEDLIRLLIDLGDAYLNYSNLKKAELYFNEALELAQKLSNTFEIGRCLSRLGFLYKSCGNFNKAKEFFEEDSILWEQLCQSDPNKRQFKHGLALSYANLGDLFRMQGDFILSKELFLKNSVLFKQLHQTDPNDLRFKHGLAVSYAKRGELLQLEGHFTEAEELFEKSIVLSEQLLQTDANNLWLKQGLAISYRNLGRLYQSLGDFHYSKDFLDKCLTLSEQLYYADPNNLQFKNGLAISYHDLGELYRIQGDFPKAIEFFEKDTILSEQLYQADPHNTLFKDKLAISYVKLGELIPEKEKAKELLSKAWQMFDELFQITALESYTQKRDGLNPLIN